MTIAVLLAAYNGRAYIEDQVSSILSQEGVHVDLFISVDVSTDETLSYCKSLMKKHTNIFLLDYGERFGGAAKNFYRLIRDVDTSGYDYIALADQDDLWHKNKLEHAVSQIKQRNLDGYSSNVTAFWPDGLRKELKKSHSLVQYDYLFESAGPGCTFVMKKESLCLFKEFMLQHESEVAQVDSHDWMLYAFFRSKGMDWYIDDYSSMLYRQHASNQVGMNSGIKAAYKRLALVRRKWYRSEVEKIYQLLFDNVPCFSLNRVFLVFNFWKLRRRLRDKFMLLLLIVFRVF